MPEKAAVQITISGKDYKLIVGPEQKSQLQKAADIVNAGIEKYRSSASLSMSGDALALCAVELAMRLLNTPSTEEKMERLEAIELLKQMHQHLSHYIAQNCQGS
jgi:cell division protein ZapA (FtsZ GTPase activity inhibitor)